MLEQASLFGRLDRPASVVLFSGLGGACEGIRRATGASPLGAINHWPYALRLHALNHPETAHYPEDVWQVPPALASRGRRLKLLWMSPDCTHFSRAKGGQPREKERRSLANVAFPWVEAARPAVLMLENVPEFEHWGPLDDEGRAIKARRGEHFREWVAKLRAHGYQVEWRQLVAADFGAPTTRKRLYLIARCDGQPIRWPEPTHGPGRAHPWRTAAECIDWDIPAPSIFERSRPLAPSTRRRIDVGLSRYVLEAKPPFMVPGQPTVAAFLVKYYGSGVGQELGRPLDTVTTVDRFGLVQVHLDGEPWTVVDIGLRMLQPRELARAMGFPDSYQLTGTKRQQVEAIGNAVCPPVARALVAANINTQ